MDTSRRRFIQTITAGSIIGSATSVAGKPGNGNGGGNDGGGGGDGGPDISSTNNEVVMQYFHEEWPTVEDDISTIANIGYDAIWIQQPAKSYLDWEDQGGRNDPALGYQPVDFRTFDSSFGTESELQSLIDTAHSYNVDVYIDTVLNHMAAASYDTFPQFEKKHFHQDVGSIDDWSDSHQVKHGELLGLKDLGQIEHIDGDPAYVRQELKNYMDKIASFGADGHRFDAVKHMYDTFFADYANAWAANNDMYGFGEVYSGDVSYVQNYVDTGMAALDYPLFFPLRRAFSYGDLSQLRGSGLVDQSPGDALPFPDNHDEDAPSQYKLAYAFVSTIPGTTVHYNLYPDWLLGENDINNMVWTKQQLATGSLVWHHDATDSIVYEREGNLVVGINNNQDSGTTVRVNTPWKGTELKDYAGNAGSITTKKNGQVKLPIPAESWVFYAP